MIGQRKRPLENTTSIESSQPVKKYQKRHSDDKLGEAHTTRVAPLHTDEQQLKFQQQQRCYGVSKRENDFSASPPGATSCDSILNVTERRALAPELREVPHDGEIRASGGSRHEYFNSLDEYESARTARRITKGGGGGAAGAAAAGHEEEDMGHPVKGGANKTQGSEALEKAEFVSTHLMSDGHVPSLSGGSAASPNEEEKKRKNGWGLLGSTSREPSSPLLLGDEHIGLHQGPPGPTINTAEKNNVEGDDFLEIRKKAVEARRVDYSPPLPILLSEKVIDLYVMDERVKSSGGYDMVTSKRLWGQVSDELGLGSDCGPGLKLIYFKYLMGLDRDRRLLLEDHHDSGLIDSVNMRGTVLSNEKILVDEKGENYFLIDEQFAESEPFHEKSGEHPMNGGSSHVSRDDHQEVDHSEDETEAGSIESDRIVAMSPAQCRAGEHQGDRSFLGNCSFSQQCHDIPVDVLPDRLLLKGHIDYHSSGPLKQGRELGNDVEEHGVSDKAIVERDNKSLANTIMWMKRLAVEPGNPQMGQGVEGTGQNEKWVTECASQARKIRALLWRRRDDIRPGDGHLHQYKQVLAPSLYYEDLPRQEQQPLERLRATRERVAHYGSSSAQKRLHDSVNLQRGSSPSLNQPQRVGQTSHRLPRQSHFHHEERYFEELPDRPHKRIPIGADFQAHVPLVRSVHHVSSIPHSARAGHSGDVTQSSDEDEEDNRWLGKQVWPPPGNKRFAYKGHLGRGRPSFCSCLDPESLDCVRLHILEERDRLKQELGQAFYIWKFDQMGEGIADEWTTDEEHAFRTLVKMNPKSQGMNFWDRLPEAFPGKKMKEFVSYYFNVFVLNRRAIQNRLDAAHLDSDDDETELPEYDSEDSDDDYESGDEVDEEADEDASEEDDEIDEEDCGPYGGDSSAKLLEDTGFCDLGGVNMIYSCTMGVISPQDESEDVPMTLCNTHLLGLEDVEQRYHGPCRGERGSRLRTVHMTAKWSHEQHDDEKHLETHISIVGEEELQEVKTWEASHWDEAGHQDLAHDPVAKGISSKGEQTPEFTPRDSSPYKKVLDGTNQHTSPSSCEGEVWGTTMDIAPINKRDKLLSTNGMIQEFFGNEVSGLNASS